MARIRSIRPEFWKSEAIACHDFFTRLTFIGLWSYVDDNGVGIDNWRLIAAELYPLEEDFARVSREVRECLARLADTGRILRYTVDGKRYIAVVNWSEHQKIDRPGKARYPGPDDPRATPTPPPTSGNDPKPSSVRETLDEPSRDPRETPSTGEGEKGRRGEGDNPSALAPLDASEGANPPSAVDSDPIDAEIVDSHPAPGLFAVPDPEPAPGTDLAVPETVNAGAITKQWIDFCTGNNVKLTNTAIKRYARSIKDALGQGFGEELIKRALAEMLRDRVVSRPALFDNYLVRAQTGPELPPRRMTRAEESAQRLAPAGVTPEQHLYDILTRPA
jgi:hypothetical protein